MDDFKANTLNVLKELIKSCHDAENLLRNACSTLDDMSLNKIFLYYAELNKTYMNKLESEIVRLGGNVEEFYQERTSQNSDKTNYLDNLKICQNGVNNAVNNYKEISLREDILWEVVPVIAKQYFGEMEVQESLKNINTQLIS